MTKSKSHQSHRRGHARKKERGTWLSVWLILIAIHAVLTIFLVRYLQANSTIEDAPYFLPLTVLIALITLVSVLGMWTWRQWGLILYAVAIVGSMVLGLVTTGSLLTVFNQILPAAILAYLLKDKWNYFG